MKIVKHEWFRTKSMLGGIVGIAALLVLASAVLTATGWPLLSTFGLMVGVIATIGLVPALQLALTVDHYRSSFGRPGYFTHTLPIRGSRIYLAKLAWVLIVTLVGLLISLAFGAITWMGSAIAAGTQLNPLVVVRDAWISIADVTPAWVPVLGIAGVLLLILSWPVTYYFAVAVGSEQRFHRFGSAGPVLVYVALYLVNQVLMVVSIVAIPLAIGMDGNRLGIIPVNLLNDLVEGSSSDVMPIGMILPLVLVTAFCLWRSIRSWNRKVSLA